MKRTHLLAFAAALLAVAYPIVVGAQISYSDAPNGGLDKRQYHNYRIEGAASTGATGNFLTVDFVSGVSNGADVTAGAYDTLTPMGGAVARTFRLVFNEADSDNPTIVLKTVGYNQFCQPATIYWTCVGDATLVSNVALLPYPTPTTTIESGASSIETSDTLNINLWGVGIDGDPRAYTEVFGLAINGAYQNPSTNFSSRFNTRYSSWNPASASDLPDNASFEIRTATRSTRVAPETMIQRITE